MSLKTTRRAALACLLVLGLAACDTGQGTTTPKADGSASGDSSAAAEPNDGTFGSGIQALNQMTQWLSANAAALPGGRC